MEQRQGYFKNAMILTLSGLLLRFAGMCFRVYLAGRLGGEGMGLYQLVFSLYSLSIAAATSGVSVAAARLVAEEMTRPDGAVQAVVRRVRAAALALGLGAGLVQFLLAGPAARFWLGDSRAAAGLRVLAPALPFMAVSSTLRGYFLGRRKTLPNALSQMAEQVVRIVLAVWMMQPALQRGVAAACTAAMLADAVSESASCLCMVCAWRRDCRGARDTAPLPGDLDRRLGAILWPVQGSRCLASALQAAENMLVPACLGLYLASRQQAMEQYGTLKGMAMPVLFFPFSFLNALSTLLMPEITQAHLQQHQRSLQRLVGRMMFLTMTLSVLMAGLCGLYAPQLGQLLYHSELVGRAIRALAPLMPWMYLESMVDGVLKGMGQQMAAFRYGIWDSILRISGVLLLLPRLGMAGFLLVMLISNLFTCTLNTRRMLRAVQMKMRWGAWVLGPLAALGIAVLLAQGMQAAGPVLPGGWPRLLVGATGVAGCYAVLMLPLGLGRELALLAAKEPRNR